MVNPEDRNIVSESIVKELLHKDKRFKGKKIQQNSKRSGAIGDFQVDDLIIEVKGLGVDESGKGLPYDFVSSSFDFSEKEWKKIQDDPKNFELWVVYRLDRKWKDPVSYAILPGTILKTCKGIPMRRRVSITKDKWKYSSQKTVPTSIWKKHKNKRRNKKNV